MTTYSIEPQSPSFTDYSSDDENRPMNESDMFEIYERAVDAIPGHSSETVCDIVDNLCKEHSHINISVINDGTIVTMCHDRNAKTSILCDIFSFVTWMYPEDNTLKEVFDHFDGKIIWTSDEAIMSLPKSSLSESVKLIVITAYKS